MPACEQQSHVNSRARIIRRTSGPDSENQNVQNSNFELRRSMITYKCQLATEQCPDSASSTQAVHRAGLSQLPNGGEHPMIACILCSAKTGQQTSPCPAAVRMSCKLSLPQCQGCCPRQKAHPASRCHSWLKDSRRLMITLTGKGCKARGKLCR